MMQAYPFPSARSVCALLLPFVLVLAGCGTTQGPIGAPVGPSHDAAAGEPEAAREITWDRDEEVDDDGAVNDDELYPGTGVFIDESAVRPRAAPPDEQGEITLNFEGQGIQEVVHAILGQMFQENYTIAPGVSGEVTFSTARPIKRDQVMPVLEMLLRWNNATLIWREGRFHVLPVSEAVRGNLVPRFGGPDAQRGYEILAVPLEFISPAKMVEILEPYAREDGIFHADGARGLLFLAGTSYELSNYLQIIRTFDVDWLAGMSVGIFTLNRVEVEDLLPELENVFGEEGETPLAGMFRFMPLTRLNALMVITPSEHYLKEAEKWIRRLDRTSPGAGVRLYVYRVKNLEADVLAGYLGELFGDGAERRQRPREGRGELAPGLERAGATTIGEFQQSRGRENSGGGGEERRSQGGMTLSEAGDVRVTAVEETNSLLIQATPTEYDTILAAIERLDEEPLQVLIEAQIVEVTLTDELRYGVNWFLSNAQPGSDDFPGFPDDSNFASSRAQDRARLGSGGFFSTVTRRGMERTFVAATLNTLETLSDVRTLSTPSLLVRNNSEARINVGRQVPIQSTSITGTTDRVFGTTQFLNTGIILEVTPRVNPGGLVYLDVRQEVSSPDQSDLDAGRNPTVSNREVSTNVAVQSGQTVMLGGLIQESNSQGRSGVPGLSRLPGVGGLFGSRSRVSDRSETLVLITPTVMDSTRRLEDVTRDIRQRFKGLEPFPELLPEKNREE